MTQSEDGDHFRLLHYDFSLLSTNRVCGREGSENLREKKNEVKEKGGKINFIFSCLDNKKVGERKVKK